MSVSYDADLIILGGGCAGLSLASQLGRHQHGPKTLVLESRDAYDNDRTWCFWAPPNHSYAHLERHHWDAWEFSTSEQATVQRSNDDTSYRCIPADAFYRDAMHVIETSDHVDVRLATQVDNVFHSGTHAIVETRDGTLHAKWVVDTRSPHLPPNDQRMLKQVFVGAEVETEHPAFDPSRAGLMTNMSVDELGFRFTYVLPFSPRRALVEETRFSSQVVPSDRVVADLDATLLQLVNAGKVAQLRTEAGCIPMSTAMVPSKRHSEVTPRVIRAGTAGGAVRASSGYAFLRIQKWATLCAAQLLAGGWPVAHPAEPNWRSAVDRLFLRVLRASPHLTPKLFMSMGKHLSTKSMVRFLSDDCRRRDFIRVACVLPKRPFLRELLLNTKAGRLP